VLIITFYCENYLIFFWLASFLCNSSQQVTFQGLFASKSCSKVKVPLGSIMGPLYVNESHHNSISIFLLMIMN